MRLLFDTAIRRRAALAIVTACLVICFTGFFSRAAEATADADPSLVDSIAHVTATEKQVRVEGISRQKSGEVLIAEIPMWQNARALKNPLRVITARVDDGKFQAEVNRDPMAAADPLLSAWATVRKDGEQYQLVSALHYVDSVASRANLPAAHPRSKKGMGGCPFNSPDMTDLGIASVTLNIVLNDLLSNKPGPNTTPYQYAGQTWYVNDRRMGQYDAELKAAAEHQCMVSAIILIHPAGNSPPGSWTRLAAHPDAAAPGVYALPNFTSAEGESAYAAVMNLLAERYSRPDGRYGRIHHWIMHNEVNSGFYWANAGTKTMPAYLDLYQKSMRLAQLIARQYDPNAKALISLDHCWTKNPEARGYAGKEMLERLVETSRREGDFDWGIAFHPYAQDLFNPRTWEDTESTFDFKTHFITFKNIEVLDAWAKLPAVMFKGTSPREIQLTEQGLNSRDYSDKALAEQAAGMAYAWEKIEPLTTITAFQYHIWMDNRDEGGLRLGLRKFSDDPHDPGGKKPLWFLYQAIGTDNWEKASAFAKSIIGIKEWNEVRHTGVIGE